MEKNKTYAGEIEIVPNAHYLGININILIRSPLCYKSYVYYESLIKIKETINILYASGNHYSLLIKRNNKIYLQDNFNNLEDSNSNIKFDKKRYRKKYEKS